MILLNPCLVCYQLAGIYKCFTYTYTIYVYFWSETVHYYLHLLLLAKTLFNVGSFTILLYLMRDSAWLTSWITSESHSFFSLEVQYVFCKVPTSLWLLFHVRTNIYILFGFKQVSMVIMCLYHGIGLSFPEIATWEIILCEPLLHWYN